MTEVRVPASWQKYEGSCDGCRAGCCSLKLMVGLPDIVRLGLANPLEHAESVASRLRDNGITRGYNPDSKQFVIAQKDGSCVFLGQDRRCTVYDRRPDVCRAFPAVGPRPGHCPRSPK